MKVLQHLTLFAFDSTPVIRQSTPGQCATALNQYEAHFPFTPCLVTIDPSCPAYSLPHKEHITGGELERSYKELFNLERSYREKFNYVGM